MKNKKHNKILDDYQILDDYITKAGFNKTKSRIGEFPKTYTVSEIESIDIDTEFDLTMAKLIAEL